MTGLTTSRVAEAGVAVSSGRLQEVAAGGRLVQAAPCAVLRGCHEWRARGVHHGRPLRVAVEKRADRAPIVRKGNKKAPGFSEASGGGGGEGGKVAPLVLSRVAVAQRLDHAGDEIEVAAADRDDDDRPGILFAALREFAQERGRVLTSWLTRILSSLLASRSPSSPGRACVLRLELSARTSCSRALRRTPSCGPALGGGAAAAAPAPPVSCE